MNHLKVDKTSKIAVSLMITLIVLGFSVIIAPSKAQNEEVIIGMDPAKLTVNEGELFNVTIYFKNFPTDPGIVAFQFKVTWDPTIITGIKMTEVLFHSVTPSDEQGNIWQLQHNVKAGYVEYAYTWQNITRAIEQGYAPISGNHTVAIITLNATTTGITTLEFAKLKIGGWAGGPLPVYHVNYPTSPLPENYILKKSTITVGNPPPLIIILSPQNMTYNKTPVNLTFTLSEPADWIGYSLDGQANVTITQNTTVTVSDGSHNIIVYANDTTGNMGVSEEKVYFTMDTTPPVASFTYSPETLEAKLIFGTYKWRISFNASGSHDSLTKIVSYTWDFGDESTGTGMVITHLYREAGTYNLTLTVKDAANNTGTETITITLTEPPSEVVPWWWIITSIAIPAVWGSAIGVYTLKTKKT